MHYLNTDGGSRGNPGPAGIGGVLKNGKEEVAIFSKYIGEKTNNQAEYAALIVGLTQAHKKGIKKITCRLDSQLIVKQLNGEYRVKHEMMKPLFAQVKKLEKEFSDISYEHVRREKNTEADALVNKALDAKLKKKK